MNIVKKLSPNFGERNGYKIELIVVHIMAGTLAGTDDWFSKSISQVSANYGVGKNEEIHQYVLDENKAWANGIINKPNFKLFKPNVNPNLYTLSIECEGYDLKDAPETQIKAICELLTYLCDKHAIPKDREHIIAHYQIDSVRKINCPSTDKSILDLIVARLQTDPKDKIREAIAILESVL